LNQTAVFIILDLRKRFGYGACHIEQILKKRGFAISHRQIEKVLVRNEMVKPNIKKQKPRKWKPEELLLLLSPLEHTELKKKLRRSEMSLVLKQGDFVPKFTSWAKNKGYSLQEITSSIIKQYLEESEDEHP